MITIRSIVYFFFLVLTTLFFSTVISLTGLFLPFRIKSRIANSWGMTNLFLLKWICQLDYKITGMENIEKQTCIIMSKHQSAWETIAFRGLFPVNQAWVLKHELMYVPLFGWALAMVNPIAIDRKSGRKAVKQVIDQGIDRLKNNRNVIIFPEGTRVAPGERKKYGIGGPLLASKSAYPVVPVAHNAGVFWRRRDLKKYPGTIEVIIGEAITTRGKSAKQISDEVEEWIENQVAKLPGSLSDNQT